MPAVVGIDLSLTSTGFALRDGTVLRLQPDCKGAERLWTIRQYVRAICAGAGLVVLEDLPTHAHGAGRTGEAHGVARLALYDLRVPVLGCPPASLKKFACGKGNATKEQMLQAAWKRLGYDGTSHDESDALWLRALGMQLLGEPLVELPKTHTELLGQFVVPRYVP